MGRRGAEGPGGLPPGPRQRPHQRRPPGHRGAGEADPGAARPPEAGLAAPDDGRPGHQPRAERVRSDDGRPPAPAAAQDRPDRQPIADRHDHGQPAHEPQLRCSHDQKLAIGESTANVTARTIGAARAVAGANARIGISGRNLVTGERLDVSADQSFPAASVGKLALLVEVYRQTSSGTLTLNEIQRADLRAMIVSSDNDAANRLMELLSTRAVNANLQALGLIGTKLVNPFGSARATGNPANVTTPGDMTRLMELLATEQLVSAQASREMRGLLLQSNDGSKLRRGLPPEARLAHKSGWYDGVANDVGIVTHPQGSYILSVFTDGINDGETANQAIAAVAEAVHALWGPKPAGEAATSRPAR